jgi:hypothetical protein
VRHPGRDWAPPVWWWDVHAWVEVDVGEVVLRRLVCKGDARCSRHGAGEIIEEIALDAETRRIVALHPAYGVTKGERPAKRAIRRRESDADVTRAVDWGVRPPANPSKRKGRTDPPAAGERVASCAAVVRSPEVGDDPQDRAHERRGRTTPQGGARAPAVARTSTRVGHALGRTTGSQAMIAA